MTKGSQTVNERDYQMKKTMLISSFYVDMWMSLFLHRLITDYNSIGNKDYFYVDLLLITVTKKRSCNKKNKIVNIDKQTL